MTPARRTATVLLLAVAFGVLAGLVKGDAPGLRSAIGNLSAPWLLVALLPGTTCRTRMAGALVGWVSTLLALSGFYATLTLTLHGHLGGGGFVRELLVEAAANRVYFVAGMVTGPLFGALGAWIGRRRPDLVGLVVGGLLAGEVVGVALLQGHQLAPPPFYFRWAVDGWGPYVGESLVGLVVVAAWALRRRAAPVEGRE